MPNYKNTVIYKIQINDRVYIGHTTNIKSRTISHRCDYKRKTIHTRLLFQYIAATNYDIDEMQLVILEEYPCDNVVEAKERERWYIEQFQKENPDLSLNSVIPNRSPRENYKRLAPRKAEQAKQRFEKNPELYKQKAKEKYQRMKEYESERHKVYYQRVKEQVALDYETNKEAINEKRRDQYRQKDKEAMNAQRREANRLKKLNTRL